MLGFAYNTSLAGVAGYTNPNPWGFIARDGSTRPDIAGIPGTNGNVALLPKPNLPDVSPFVSAMMLIRACEYGYMKRYHMVTDSIPIPAFAGGGTFETQRIRPWVIKPGVAPIPLTDVNNTPYTYQDLSGAAAAYQDIYEEVLEFYDYGDIVIRFGAPEPARSTVFDEEQIVNYCGEITIPTTTAVEILNAGGQVAGAWNAQIEYFYQVLLEWHYEENAAHRCSLCGDKTYRYATMVQTMRNYQ